MSKVVIISGIAQGMGRQVAPLLLAEQGYSLAGFDIDSESVKSLKQELDAFSQPHFLASLDITDKAKLNKFRSDVLKKFDRVDTVLSNVGVGFFGPFEEVDLDKAMTALNINIIGCARLLQSFVPHMREQGGGKLIAMSSLVGQIPFPFESIYSASKFAVEGMVSSLRYEVAPFGIKVALIEPAQVSTDFAAKVHKLPKESSPYYSRVKAFIERDEELIKTATTPEQAARRIAKVVMSKNPKQHNQVDFMSTFFLFLNRVLPGWLRDFILLNHMNIRV